MYILLNVIGNTDFVVHEAVKFLHQYMFEHVQVSNQDMWLLSNVESVGLQNYYSYS